MNNKQCCTQDCNQGRDCPHRQAVDVTQTWRKFGWKPKAEIEANIQSLLAIFIQRKNKSLLTKVEAKNV